MARRAAAAILVLAAACGTPSRDSAAAQSDTSTPAVATAAPGAGLPSWSAAAWGSRADRRDAVALELARDAAGATAELAAARAADEPTFEPARTVARIGGADAAASLLELLERGDRQPSAAELAAVGLLEPPPGLPGEPREPDGVWSTLERDLWTRFAVDEDNGRMRASSFALARIGGAYSQGLWSVELAAPDADSTRRVAVLEAMGIACARRHRLHDRSLPLVATIVEGPPSPERAAAIYALARCAGPSAESFAGPERAAWVERLTAVLGDDDAALAWKALAGLGEVPTAIPAAILGAAAPDFATEVEAVRALAGHASGRTAMIERLTKLDPLAESGARINVLLTALQALRKPIEAAPELLEPLRPWAERIAAAPASDPRRRIELALVRCELLVLESIVHDRQPALAHCSEDIEGLPPHHGAVLAVEAAAIGLAGTERADVLLAAAGDRRAAVAEAALSALADLDDPRVSTSLRTALASTDVGVLAAAAGAIAARAADRDKRDPQAVAVLEAMLARVDAQQAIEARLSAIEALGAMARSAGGLQEGAPTGDDEGRVWLERTIVPLATDPNDAIRRAAWTALFGFDELRTRFAAAVPTSFPSGFAPAVHAALEQPPAVGLRIHTALGELVIAFTDAPSPIAQASLVALARAGRFDGLRFHRVVPGFVVQGGDPRGDGYGGPGWVLPCEWSELRYERGTVGIALAGKDTGGSQFFIAQSRQPHLDGRFTVIGRVTEGLELVDRILPHERIDRVEVIEGSGP